MFENIIRILKKFKDSIYTGSLNPESEPDRLGLIFRSLILHLHPPQVNKKTIKFNHTFGLGGMAIILICMQFITGLLLRFYYEPFPGQSYDSILNLNRNVLFGGLIRNLHYWGSVFLIIITILHLLRVFFTGAFQDKRQFNWVIGLFLLILIIFSNFTGYLLPWDQLSYWAVTVSTSMLDYLPFLGTSIKNLLLGGDEIGSSTLLIFYNFHTGILPILIILTMSFHFWRVRKAGGVIVPKNDDDDEFVSTIPNLVAKEFVVMLVLIAFIFGLAILFDAPLLEKANPNFSPNPAKAPWYFLGIQELMIHFHPLYSVFILPFLGLLFLIFFPYLDYKEKGNGAWFYSEKGKKIVLRSSYISFALTFAYVLFSEYVFKANDSLSHISNSEIYGLIPITFIALLIYFYHVFLIRKENIGTVELIQSLFTILFVSFLVLTLVGIFLRGEGMNLILF